MKDIVDVQRKDVKSLQGYKKKIDSLERKFTMDRKKKNYVLRKKIEINFQEKFLVKYFYRFVKQYF